MKQTIMILLGILLTTLLACEKSAKTADITIPREYPSLPVYVQPGNNSSITYQPSGYLVFKWNACSDPQGDPVTYDLVIGGAEQIVVQSLTSNEDSIPFDQFYSVYHTWYIIARDNHGNFTQGPTWKFAIP